MCRSEFCFANGVFLRICCDLWGRCARCFYVFSLIEVVFISGCSAGVWSFSRCFHFGSVELICLVHLCALGGGFFVMFLFFLLSFGLVLIVYISVGALCF